MGRCFVVRNSDSLYGLSFEVRGGWERFRTACARCEVTQSMGAVGSSLGNSVIESWHSTLEFELRSLEHFATRAQARVRVATWIEEYNHDRRHSALGMRSPVQF